MRHREDALGQLRRPSGDVPDQLLEIERVSVRTLDGARDRFRVGGLAQRRAHQPLRRAQREAAQVDLLNADPAPEPGELLADLRSTQREQHERPVGQALQRFVEEREGRQVAPVEVLED